MKHFTLFILCIIGSFVQVIAQNSGNEHKFTLVLAHANLADGINPSTGKREWLALPAWCFDYDFSPSEKWSIGLHNDIIIETFEVESNDSKTIKRTRPVSSSIVGTYKFDEHLALQLGMGGEFAKEENFVLTRIGIEYGWALPKNFEVSGIFNYDIKWNAYDTYVIGIGVAKIIR
jgi:hypothetical protein